MDTVAIRFRLTAGSEEICYTRFQNVQVVYTRVWCGYTMLQQPADRSVIFFAFHLQIISGLGLTPPQPGTKKIAAYSSMLQLQCMVDPKSEPARNNPESFFFSEQYRGVPHLLLT